MTSRWDDNVSSEKSLEVLFSIEMPKIYEFITQFCLNILKAIRDRLEILTEDGRFKIHLSLI